MVFCADCNDLDYDLFYSVLDREERKRASRFVVENARKLMVFAHGLKRFLLSKILDHPPEQLQFSKNEHGKPYALASNAPYFNLSHSGNMVMIGISSLGEIGVDVEFPGNFSYKNIENAVLSKEELQHFSPSAEWQDFLLFWTQKEALGKVCSLGLGIDFPKISVSGQEGNQKIVFQGTDYYLQSYSQGEKGVISLASTSPQPLQVYSIQEWGSGSCRKIS
jgi:phosphopantetheinyl transferase